MHLFDFLKAQLCLRDSSCHQDNKVGFFGSMEKHQSLENPNRKGHCLPWSLFPGRLDGFNSINREYTQNCSLVNEGSYPELLLTAVRNKSCLFN